MIRRSVNFLDERLGAASMMRKGLRYVFPDHWSFLLGEIALYAFVVLVGTGIYMSFFFVPSYGETTYSGSYEPLMGATMTEAYKSAVELSFDVSAGLLMRQTHHWAANVFVVAIVLHLLRIFFSGAFRKPRELNYLIGITLLILAVFEGFTGYSMPDDLLSGIGLVIAYGVLMAVPFVGGDLAFLAWGGEFPGVEGFLPRLYIVHVLIVPMVLAVLIGLHLAMIARQKHTDFPGGGRTERNVIGTPAWPAYSLKSLGLFFATAATLFLLGGLVQINPIWQWGPFEPYQGTNGAQPDWYVGWLIGSLRLMPPLEVTVFDYTLMPNPFFGGVLFPLVSFGFMYAWPAIERRITGDRGRHELLDRPRDNPWRTGVGAGFFTWVATIFVAGASDRVLVNLGIPYEAQVWFFRVVSCVLPFVVFFLVRRVCLELQAAEAHPLRGFTGTVVRRTPEGGFEVLGDGARAAPDGGPRAAEAEEGDARLDEPLLGHGGSAKGEPGRRTARDSRHSGEGGRAEGRGGGSSEGGAKGE